MKDQKTVIEYAMLPELPEAKKDYPEYDELYAVPETRKKLFVNIFIPEEPKDETSLAYDNLSTADPVAQKLVLTERIELPLVPQFVPQEDLPELALLSDRYSTKGAVAVHNPNLPAEPAIVFDRPVMSALEAHPDVDEFYLADGRLGVPTVPEEADIGLHVDNFLAGTVSGGVRKPDYISFRLRKNL